MSISKPDKRSKIEKGRAATNSDRSSATENVKKWLAIRKKAGRQIDPETAEVDWWYAQVVDPYGVRADIPEELQQVGRDYFARSPGSDVWVWFGDLPIATRDALWEKHKSKLAFPAGLFYGRSKPRKLDQKTRRSRK
jgi:hypothetical protein